MSTLNIISNYIREGIIACFLLVAPFLIKAQSLDLKHDPYYERIIPSSPEVQKFSIYGNAEINKAKGLPSISIPLFELQEDGVSVPVGISYTGNGVRVNDISGAVGMNWSLSAGGMVSRNVRGKADEKDNVGWFDSQNNITNLELYYNDPTFVGYQDDIKRFFSQGEVNIPDNQPDEFSYQFGGYSGTFFFDKNKTLCKKMSDPIKIKMVEPSTSLIYFIISDEWGNTYYFGTEASSREISNIRTEDQLTNVNAEWSENVVSCWKLSKIMTKNGHVVNFNYLPYDDHTIPFNSNGNLDYQITSNQEKSQCTDSRGYCEEPHPEYISSMLVWSEFEPKLISSITSDNIRIDFKYSNVSSLDPYQMELDSATMTDLIGQHKKGFKFEYIESNKRFLYSIEELNSSLASAGGATYVFNYWGETAVPEYNSFAQDYYGYYNGCNNNITLITCPPDITFAPKGNRKIIEKYLKYGTIYSIKYPTGGYTYFEWEPNYEKIVNTTDSIFTPGLRIKRIYDKDENNAILNDKRYVYSGLTGYHITQGLNKEAYFIKDLRHSLSNSTIAGYTLYSNDPQKKVLTVDDYYYKTIEEYYYASNILTGRISEEYNGTANDNSYSPYLVNQKIEKYENEKYIISKEIKNVYSTNHATYYPYYILGDSRSIFRPGYGVVHIFDGLIAKSITLSNPQISSQTIKEYMEGSSIPITTQNLFTYNSYGIISDKTNRILNETQDVIYESNKIKYSYPSDMNGTVYEEMTMANMLNYPIEQTISKNGYIIKSMLTTFSNTWASITDNKHYLSKQVFSLETTAPLSTMVYFNGETKDSHYGIAPETEFLDYNSKGNLLNFKQRGGSTTTYTWGYNGQYITSKTIKETGNINSSVFTESWEWYPLIGMKWHIDQTGLKTNYEYDPFGRLKTVTNNTGKILQQTEYHYKQ